MRDHPALGIGRSLVPRLDRGAVLAQALFDLGDAGCDLGGHVETDAHVFGFGDFETHDVFTVIGVAVDSKPGAVRPPVLEGGQHRGHLGANAGGLAPMDQSCNSTHAVAP